MIAAPAEPGRSQTEQVADTGPRAASREELRQSLSDLCWETKPAKTLPSLLSCTVCGGRPAVSTDTKRGGEGVAGLKADLQDGRVLTSPGMTERLTAHLSGTRGAATGPVNAARRGGTVIITLERKR